MNILAVTPRYPPESRVGSWLATHEWLKGLAGRGHAVKVMSQGLQEEPYTFEGIPVVRRHRRFPELFETADVVISHLGDNMLATRFALRHGKKSVSVAHSVPARREERLRGCELLVANSQATADAIGFDGDTLVCHPVTWPDDYMAWEWDPQFVTQVNLSENKGGKVFWELAARMPEVEFLGVQGGYGFQVDGDLPNVTVVGTQDDMRRVYEKTRVLLMPSRFESWGMTGVEAMVSGIPVVAHPTPGLRESLGFAGIFADRDDVDGWEAAVRNLLSPEPYEWAATAAVARAGELDPQRSIDDFCDAVEAL